jgi:hypothetical protein
MDRLLNVFAPERLVRPAGKRRAYVDDALFHPLLELRVRVQVVLAWSAATVEQEHRARFAASSALQGALLNEPAERREATARAEHHHRYGRVVREMERRVRGTDAKSDAVTNAQPVAEM